MHSLALYLSDAGHEVSGSDPCASAKICEFWSKRGCTVHKEQKTENVHGYDLVIYSSAVPATNPERQEAERLGTGMSRGEALAKFSNEHRGSIAVCGTHGKGTTAAAILYILKQCGYHVSDVLGAVPIGCHEPSLFVKEADYLVCEVDESDKTNLFHRPDYLVINNVEEDHLNVYKDLDDIVTTFANHVKVCLDHGTKVIIHYAGIGAPKLYEQLKDYGEINWICEEGEIDSPYLGIQIAEPDDKGRCLLTIREFGGDIYRIYPMLGGRANAQNLATAICTARVIGLNSDKIAIKAAEYKGLNDRCQIQSCGDIKLVTDYASHPTCVKNDLSWLRPQSKRLVVIYHPYRYSLMQCHWNGLSESLSQADVVLLAPMDGAGETPIAELTSENLAVKIKQRRDDCEVQAFKTFEQLEETAHQLIQSGDSLVVFGGGSLFSMGRRIVFGT